MIYVLLFIKILRYTVLLAVTKHYVFFQRFPKSNKLIVFYNKLKCFARECRESKDTRHSLIIKCDAIEISASVAKISRSRAQISFPRVKKLRREKKIESYAFILTKRESLLSRAPKRVRFCSYDFND